MSLEMDRKTWIYTTSSLFVEDKNNYENNSKEER